MDKPQEAETTNESPRAGTVGHLSSCRRVGSVKSRSRVRPPLRAGDATADAGAREFPHPPWVVRSMSPFSRVGRVQRFAPGRLYERNTNANLIRRRGAPPFSRLRSAGDPAAFADCRLGINRIGSKGSLRESREFVPAKSIRFLGLDVQLQRNSLLMPGRLGGYAGRPSNAPRVYWCCRQSGGNACRAPGIMTYATCLTRRHCHAFGIDSAFDGTQARIRVDEFGHESRMMQG